MKYIESKSTDPGWNLAMEERLFEILPKGSECVFLWQNDNTIVVGKNQNTQAEINGDFVSQNGIRVVRRLSGGGAVYHDLGNLNFTFIADGGERIDFGKFCAPMIETLRSFGLDARLSGRNDMTIDGKKFSGNAQYLNNGRALHHGTILFSSDLTVLSQALRVDRTKIESKAIRSVASRVTNLKEYLPEGTTLQDLKVRLLEHLGELEPLTLTAEDEAAIGILKKERYDTWEWNYGRSPEHIVTNRRRIEGCGIVTVCCQVEHGIIRGLTIRGDFFGSRDISELEELLVGCRFQTEEIRACLDKADLEKYILGISKQELAELIEGRGEA